MSIPLFFSLIVAFASLALGQIVITAVEDMTKCPEKTEWKATLESTEVENCPDLKKPCNLIKGHNYTITIHLKSSEEIKTVSALVKGVIAGIAVDYIVPQPNACEKSGLVCPLEPGNSVTYQAVLPVKTIYPSISLKVRWALIDEFKNTVICVMIPVRISNKSPAAHH